MSIEPAPSLLVSTEAEQALLGALLCDNRAFENVVGVVSPEDFGNAIHARIFDAIRKCVDSGTIANPVTLGSAFAKDEAMIGLGGPRYLARLASSAVTLRNAADYARAIADLARRRIVIDLCRQTMEDAGVVDLDRPALKILDDHEQRLFDLSEQRQRGHGFVSIGEAAKRVIESVEAAYKRGGAIPGVATGLADLDRMLGGLLPGDLEIIAGRPAMGKTALAVDIALYAAQHGVPAVIYELEQTGEQLAQRKLASASGIPTGRQRRGELQQSDWRWLIDATEELASVPLYIDDTPALSVGEIRQRARRMRRRHKIGLVVVDHLQLVRVAGKVENRRLEVGAVTRTLKQLAKELQVPVLLLSQLSRAVEQREPPRPVLSDLRESGDIEQDADRVMFLYREEYYVERDEPQRRSEETEEKFAARHEHWDQRRARCQGIAEIIIAKDRHGPTGFVRVHWDAPRMRFENLAR